MLRRFPTFQVATTCFSCSPPDLNLLDPYFIFMYMHNNHCHWVTAHLQLNILLLLLLLLTPWCRDLLEQLTGLQLVKKFPAFHGTRRFITALTSVRQLSLHWTSPIQSIYPHTTSWRSILILSTHLRLGLPSGLLFTYLLTHSMVQSPS